VGSSVDSPRATNLTQQRAERHLLAPDALSLYYDGVLGSAPSVCRADLLLTFAVLAQARANERPFVLVTDLLTAALPAPIRALRIRTFPSKPRVQ